MEVHNIYDIINIMNLNDSELITRLQEAGLLNTNFRCPVRRCRRPCTLQNRSVAVLGAIFCCNWCKKRYSLLTGSFFSQMIIPIRSVFFLMWEWACEIRAGCAAMALGCSRVTAIQQYQFYRDICSWKLLQHEDLFLLGK